MILLEIHSARNAPPTLSLLLFSNDAIHDGIEKYYTNEISKEEYNYDLYRTEDGIQGEQFQQNEELRSSTQFFAQYNMNFLDDLELEVGLNANLTSYTLDDQFASDMTDISGEYNYSWIYSPRLNLKYTLNESDHLYGLISHGYSIPTLEETLTPD